MVFSTAPGGLDWILPTKIDSLMVPSVNVIVFLWLLAIGTYIDLQLWTCVLKWLLVQRWDNGTDVMVFNTGNNYAVQSIIYRT